MLNEGMNDYLKRVFTFFGLVALVPFGLGFTSSWAPGLSFLLFILALPAALLALAGGGILWFVRGLRLAGPQTNHWNKMTLLGVAPLLLACTVLVSWPLLASGSFLGSLSRLFVNHGQYEAIIAKARVERRPVWFEDQGGVIYSVDLGPPVRVAFNPAGMLDNWSGIIYDPTGEVMLAKGFDPHTGKFAAPDHITKLFDGDLVGCRHLWADYYDCSFT